jgi:hypothetical protein
MIPPVEKHFQERGAEPQVPPLRSPGFPVEIRGADLPRASLFKREPHTWSWRLPRSTKSGYAPVPRHAGAGGMTRGRDCGSREQEPFFITLGGPQAHDSSGRDDKGRRLLFGSVATWMDGSGAATPRRLQIPALLRSSGRDDKGRGGYRYSAKTALRSGRDDKG